MLPRKQLGNHPKNFLTAPGITSEDRTPPYSWLRSKTCWQKHISDTYDSAFENWLYGWESAAILTKTFPQHIETSTLPTLLKAYDNIKSCCVGEYVEHRLHITHVAMAAPRWRFESVRAHQHRHFSEALISSFRFQSGETIS